MLYENDKELAMRYANHFGAIAIRKGFVSAKQVNEALAEQTIYHSFTGLRQHKFIIFPFVNNFHRVLAAFAYYRWCI